VTLSRAYAVDYTYAGASHHTVVMAPGDKSAAMHVRVSRPGSAVVNVQRVPPAHTPKEDSPA
jgi:hypothetical protein